MENEIKIGSRVKLLLTNCPGLIVEKITETEFSDGKTTIKRNLLSCVWFDNPAQTFKRNEFYADTVYLDT